MNRPLAVAASVLVALLPLGTASSQPPPARIGPGNDLTVMAREPFQIFDNLYFVGIGEVGSYVIETSEGLILIISGANRSGRYCEDGQDTPRSGADAQKL